MTNAAMIEFLPDPTLLIFGSGQTERANQAGKDEKMEILYGYLTSIEF